MKIEGKQAYPCMFECPDAVWIGDGINGDWYCDNSDHDRSPQDAQQEADDQRTIHDENRSFGAREY